MRAKFEEATTTWRLAKLESENTELQERLAAVRAALTPPASAAGAAGGVSAARAAGKSSNRTERRTPLRTPAGAPLEHLYFDPADSRSDTEWEPMTKRDTVNLCTADRHGNVSAQQIPVLCLSLRFHRASAFRSLTQLLQSQVVSATPSGGFLWSAPCVPGLGFPTSTRGQMLTLEPGCANTLRPGCRPRTTLSPTVALKDGRPDLPMAFGTPGADAQDQVFPGTLNQHASTGVCLSWCANVAFRVPQHSLSFFLRHVHHGMDPQAAIDYPSFSTYHLPSSFGGGAYPNVVNLEGRMPAATAAGLSALGHKVNHREDSEGGFGREGSVNAVGVRPAGADGTHVFGAANPRGAQGYCVGR